MNKSVHPAVAALVIASVVLIFGVKYWLDQKVLELPRPALMQPHPSGGVVVLVGLSLYHLAESGELLTTLDLEPLGVTEMVGDFAFFANGDLLIRTTSASQNLSDNLATFGRLENSSYGADGEQNMLSRCVLAAKTCAVFTRQLPALNRTFRLHVDWSDDTVFVADTSRHRVLKFNARGDLQGGSQEMFKFPNQLRVYDHKLWVADTNHHSLRALSTATDNFGAEIESHLTKAGGEWRWPSAFLRVGESWWVDVMSSGMSNGKIIVYGPDWQRRQEVALPEHADPVAIEKLGRRVLISDWGNIAIYQFSDDGVRLPDLEVKELSARLIEIRARAKLLKTISWSLLGLFAISLFVGFIFAVRTAQNSRGEAADDQSDNTSLTDVRSTVPPEGIGFAVNGLFRSSPTIALLVILSGLGTTLYIHQVHTQIFEAVAIPLLLLAMAFIPSSLAVRRLANCQVRLYPDRLLLTDHEGLRKQAGFDRLVWSDTAVLVKDQVIPLTNSQGYEVYPGLADALKPVLQQANKITGSAMLRHRWRSPDGLLKAAVVTAVLLFLTMAYFERDVVLAWLSSPG